MQKNQYNFYLPVLRDSVQKEKSRKSILHVSLIIHWIWMNDQGVKIEMVGRVEEEEWRNWKIRGGGEGRDRGKERRGKKKIEVEERKREEGTEEKRKRKEGAWSKVRRVLSSSPKKSWRIPSNCFFLPLSFLFFIHLKCLILPQQRLFLPSPSLEKWFIQSKPTV